jgi:hypothetical protein
MILEVRGAALINETLYQRVCDSYQAVDDFRTKLLGLLPVATGTGVFLLLSGKAELFEQGGQTELAAALAAIGIFGLLFTFGLFSYELFGTKKCHYLISCGKRIEDDLGVEGQFRSRPPSLARCINEPFAASIIYPACMAAWAYVAIVFSYGPSFAGWTAFAILLLGCVLTMAGLQTMAKRASRDELAYVTIRDKSPSPPSEFKIPTSPAVNMVEDASVRRLIKSGRVVVTEENKLEVRTSSLSSVDRST